MRISDWSSDVCSSDLRDFGQACGGRAIGRDDRRALELVRAIDVEQLRVAILHTDARIGDLGIDEYIPHHVGQFAAAQRHQRLELICEIGRASCRERVCQYVSISGVGGTVKKKQKEYLDVKKENNKVIHHIKR